MNDDERNDPESKTQSDLPFVVASREGPAGRFAPLPATPPTGR